MQFLTGDSLFLIQAIMSNINNNTSNLNSNNACLSKNRNKMMQSDNSVKKRKQKKYSLEMKLDIIKRRHSNQAFGHIARELDMPITTVKTIVARKDQYLTGSQDVKIKGEKDIQLKDVLNKTRAPDDNSATDPENKTTSISVLDGCQRVHKELSAYIKNSNYCAQQVFNLSAMRLKWKNIEIVKDGNKRKRKPKETVTLLFITNAQGDFKIKPLLVHCSENPLSMYGKDKTLLPVTWRSNSDIAVTKSILIDWFISIFKPSVKEYLTRQDMPFRLLLLVDDSLSDAFCPSLTDNFMEMETSFMPTNATNLSQPMHSVLSTFRRCYTSRLMTQAISVIDMEECTTLDEFLNDYNIWRATYSIADSWNDITSQSINKAWFDLCPQFVTNAGQNDAQEQIDITINELKKRILPLLSIAGEINNRESVTTISHTVLRHGKTYVDNSEHNPKIALKVKDLLDTIQKEDCNHERASNVIQDLRNRLSCYLDIEMH